MDAFRQSWDLEKFIREQNSVNMNITPSQAESTKISADETKSSPSAAQISSC